MIYGRKCRIGDIKILFGLALGVFWEGLYVFWALQTSFGMPARFTRAVHNPTAMQLADSSTSLCELQVQDSMGTSQGLRCVHARARPLQKNCIHVMIVPVAHNVHDLWPAAYLLLQGSTPTVTLQRHIQSEADVQTHVRSTTCVHGETIDASFVPLCVRHSKSPQTPDWMPRPSGARRRHSAAGPPPPTAVRTTALATPGAAPLGAAPFPAPRCRLPVAGAAADPAPPPQPQRPLPERAPRRPRRRRRVQQSPHAASGRAARGQAGCWAR